MVNSNNQSRIAFMGKSQNEAMVHNFEAASDSELHVVSLTAYSPDEINDLRVGKTAPTSEMQNGHNNIKSTGEFKKIEHLK